MALSVCAHAGVNRISCDLYNIIYTMDYTYTIYMLSNLILLSRHQY